MIEILPYISNKSVTKGMSLLQAEISVIPNNLQVEPIPVFKIEKNVIKDNLKCNDNNKIKLPNILAKEENEKDSFVLDMLNKIHKELELDTYASIEEFNKKTKKISDEELIEMGRVVCNKATNLYNFKKEDIVPFYETITKLQKLLELNSLDDIQRIEILKTNADSIKIIYYDDQKEHSVEAFFNNNIEPIWLKISSYHEDRDIAAKLFLFDKMGKIKSKITYKHDFKEIWNESLKDYEMKKFDILVDYTSYKAPVSPKIIADEYRNIK